MEQPPPSSTHWAPTTAEGAPEAIRITCGTWVRAIASAPGDRKAVAPLHGVGHHRGVQPERLPARRPLRWLVGVALVLVVVSGLTLLAAHRRTQQRWISVTSTLEDGYWRFEDRGQGLPKIDVLTFGDPFGSPGYRPFLLSRIPLPVGASTTPSPILLSDPDRRGGHALRGWRERSWHVMKLRLVLRQRWSPLGSHIEAQVHDADPAQVETLRAVLETLDVKLVGEGGPATSSGECAYGDRIPLRRSVLQTGGRARRRLVGRVIG